MSLAFQEMVQLDQEQLRSKLLYLAIRRLNQVDYDTQPENPYDILRQTIDDAYECGYLHGAKKPTGQAH